MHGIAWYYGVVVITTARLYSPKSDLRFCASFKSCSRHVRDLRWWESLTVVPAGNNAKRFSSVNHCAKTIHHYHGRPNINFWPLLDILYLMRIVICDIKFKFSISSK